MGVAVEVDGDQLGVADGEDAGERALGGGAAVGVVHRGHRDRLLDDGGEVDQRHVGRGHPHREPVELALHLGDHLGERLGRAGGRRDHREAGGARAAHVLVRLVEDRLVVGVAVDGGHDAVHHAEALVEHLDHRGQAVGGARGVGDDVVRGGVVPIGVDAEAEGGHVLALGGRADDHLLRPAVDVGARLVPVGELARALEDDVHAGVAPGDLGGVLLGGDGDALAVDHDGLVGRADLAAEAPVHRVVLHQVGERGRVGEVVDQRYLDAGFAVGVARAHDHAADAAESVDPDAGGAAGHRILRG